MRKAGQLTPEQFWARMAQIDDQIRASAHVMPLYGAADLTESIMTGDWHWQNDRLTTAGLIHGEQSGSGPYVHVRITTDDPAAVVSDLRMRSHSDPRDKDPFLKLRERLASTPTTGVEIAINGRLEPFNRWDDGAGWYAATRHGGYGVVIEARELTPDQINLVRVEDIEPYLAGRRAYIRALRSEA
ncbi:hypothetical protein ACNTMW_12750 [Planosporangium sp. 12N6]|uniref:hypothetical protein n=1 Tax=Planosporangium spinosum TaxID=3402278 RepID=UPI003CED75F8